MKRFILILLLIILTAGCIKTKTLKTDSTSFKDIYLKNVTQLTFDGDNAEAYFSSDGKRLIYQSNRGGYNCDKIWTMNIEALIKRW